MEEKEKENKDPVIKQIEIRQSISRRFKSEIKKKKVPSLLKK
jgi:hypothetical protein